MDLRKLIKPLVDWLNKPYVKRLPPELPKPPQLHMDQQALSNYAAISSGRYANIGIVPCYVNGEASSAIVTMHRQPDGSLHVAPMFVDVTHSMKLEDQFGQPMDMIHENKKVADEAQEFLDSIVSQHLHR